VTGVHIRENDMNTFTRHLVVGAALTAVLAASPALAQQGTRVRGTIEKVDGNTLMLKARDGSALTLTLTGNPTVVSVAKASLADIKEGSFVGSGAMPPRCPFGPRNTAPLVEKIDP